MERLTQQNSTYYEKAIKQLQEYENTGLTPAEIEQLQKENAELKSRLEKSVELPCKVGDILYKKDYLGGKIREYKVIAISVFNSTSVKNKIEVTAHNYRGASVPINVEYLINNLGKTIFITREEAKQVLKERE